MQFPIEKFQYLTWENSSVSAVRQAEIACHLGAKWLQYRNISSNEAFVRDEVQQIAQICQQSQTTLLVSNRIYLSDLVEIGGFHIEDTNTDISKIRAKLGKEKIIGASAHSLEEVINHYENGANYVSFGPFKPSKTKSFAGNCVGIEGYQNLIEKCRLLAKNVPIYAVGGVQLEDIYALMTAGVSGIAVSGAIYTAPDFAKTYQDFQQKIIFFDKTNKKR